jgi:hypothetical protein
MREKLNNNPLAQAGLVGVLLLVAAVFLLAPKGGGEEESVGAEGSAVATAELAISAGAESAAVAPPAPGALAAVAPPPPSPVTAAFEANQTVALLFVRNGGIDDRMVADAVDQLRALGGVATFVIPASRIARYAAITQGVDVDRVPALVVVRPKRLDNGIPTASVQYGFQSSESVVQAVVDAGYKGRTLDYHP